MEDLVKQYNDFTNELKGKKEIDFPIRANLITKLGSLQTRAQYSFNNLSDEEKPKYQFFVDEVRELYTTIYNLSRDLLKNNPTTAATIVTGKVVSIESRHKKPEKEEIISFAGTAGTKAGVDKKAIENKLTGFKREYQDLKKELETKLKKGIEEKDKETLNGKVTAFYDQVKNWSDPLLGKEILSNKDKKTITEIKSGAAGLKSQLLKTETKEATKIVAGLKKEVKKLEESLEKEPAAADNKLLIAGLITGSTGLGMGGAVGAGVATIGVEAGAAAVATMIGVSTALTTIMAVAIPAVLVAAGIGLLIAHAVQQGQQEGINR